jgi:hypothetical protein
MMERKGQNDDDNVINMNNNIDDIDNKNNELDVNTKNKEKNSKILSLSTGELGMYLPPPTTRNVHFLLTILRDSGSALEAIEVLTTMCARARESDSAVDLRPQFSALPEALPLTLTQSGRHLVGAQYSPSRTTFALVIEACVNAKNASLALATFGRMEQWYSYMYCVIYLLHLNNFI